MIDPQLRFEIIGNLGQGDFATVYRARDRELGREVAIKQIHPQFLQDPRHLDRYWQEAQLLAKLEHPHIMTIYDIVRDRGWLVLELMNGSLQQLLAGRPIDLNDLRMAIIYTAHALQFLQQHGIFHGDVKPGNLMVDKNQRVKLGDFGIARRLVGDHGSVVKGTTKYMAPEVFSDQFGPPGPHSDLYSLGFTAYELMCGENFESLFPGLNMFGKDRQMAWMMWHSAADRRLPEIARVLQGVPDDLAHVITKLTEKDPAKRYRSAEQVIADLRGANMVLDTTPEQQAAAEIAAKKAKQRKILAFAAMGVSVALSASMLFLPTETQPPPPVTQEKRPQAGAVGEVDFANSRFFLKVDDDPVPRPVAVNPELDRFFVNDQRADFKTLQKYDQLSIKYLASDGQAFREFYIRRATEQQAMGTVTRLDPLTDTVRLAAADELGGTVQVFVPTGTPIEINGQTEKGGRPYRFDDINTDDRASVTHLAEDGGRLVAKRLVLLRLQTHVGKLLGRNSQDRTFTIQPEAANGKSATPRDFKLAERCEISINGVKARQGDPFTLADLLVGDQITIAVDAQAHRIEARRETRVAGRIEQVRGNERSFDLLAETGGAAKSYHLPPGQEVMLAGRTETVPFDFLQTGDRAEIEYETINEQTRNIRSLQATLAPDPRTWVVLIAQQNFDDQRVPSLPYALADAQQIRSAMMVRYRVPEAQILFEPDTTRTRLEQTLAAFLPRVPAASQFVCHVVGHVLPDGNGTPMLVPKDFNVARPTETGIPLRWLISQLETCAATDKTLLLDTSHDVAAMNGKPPLSAAEQAASLKSTAKRPVSTSVTVIASCEKGQVGAGLDNNARGAFGSAVAAAFAGRADTNGDRRVDGNELFSFLSSDLAKTTSPSGKRQAPVRFLPDATPPRITEAGQEAIRKLLRFLKSNRYDDTIESEFNQTQKLVGRQPEPALAYALALLKHSRPQMSLPVFERTGQEFPFAAVAFHGAAFQRFAQGKYSDGIGDLKKLVQAVPDGAGEPNREAYFRHVFEFAALLREFAVAAAEPALQRADVEELDRAVAARGETAKEHYRKGVQAIRSTLKTIDAEITAADVPEAAQRLRLERKRFTRHVVFNFDVAADFLRAVIVD